MLGGRGVPSIDGAIRELMVEPIRAPFRALVNPELLQQLIALRGTSIALDAPVIITLEERLMALLSAIKDFIGDDFPTDFIEAAIPLLATAEMTDAERMVAEVELAENQTTYMARRIFNDMVALLG